MVDASAFGFGLVMAVAIALLVGAGLRRFAAPTRAATEANRHFEATFDQAAVGIAHLDPGGSWLRVNGRYCEIAGYDCAELLRKGPRDITHPDDVPRDLALQEDLLSGRCDHGSLEKRYIREDGRVGWVNETRTIVRDAAGRPEFFISIVEDITSHKAAEAQVVIGEAQYRAIFYSAVEAMAVIDAKGAIHSANPAVKRVFGYAPEEVIGKDITMLMPEAIGRQFDSHRSRYRDAERHKIIGIGPEVSGRRKDGTVFPLDLSIAEWRRSGDVFLTCVMRDVTARRASQSALAASEAHLAVVYAQPGAGVAETDLGRRFVSANDRYCEIVGRNREELLQLGMQDIVHLDDLRDTGPLFDRLVTADEPFSAETRYVKPDGSIACVMSTASAIKLDDAAPTIVVVAIDVTERKEAEKALRASEERLRLLQNEFAHLARVNDLGEMAAAIAHEINQPLTAIVNYLNTGLFFSAEGYGGDAVAETEQIMRQACEQALRAGEIVRRLREFVGQDNGARTVECAEQLVDSAMALALIDARSSGIAVDRTAGMGEAEVEVDAVQIQQVLVNLLRNAVDALGGLTKRARPRLTVSTRASDDGMLEFIVADNGLGIAPQLADRIFEPFMTTKAKGMGMGLSVCRRLIESHGGTIDADSKPGAGAAFKMRLPRYRSIPA